jgi:hypothetical protein
MPVSNHVASQIPDSVSELKALAAALLAQLSEQACQVQTQAAQLEAKTAQLDTQAAQLETQTTQLKHQSVYIDKLKFELARLKRWRFGAASESIGSEQIALWETELDGDIAAIEARLGQLQAATAAPEIASPNIAPPTAPKTQPKRKPLPDSLPRVEVRYEIASCTCPACGLGLTPMGEEITEQLDIIPARFFVRRHIRPKYIRHRCRHNRSTVVWRRRDCWRMCWPRSIWTIFLCIARNRFMRVTAWCCRARPWPAGSASSKCCSSLWLSALPATFCPAQ